MISGQDWPLRSADEIIEYFVQHTGENFTQYWSSKNFGKHIQNNFDKRNQIYFPIKLIGRKPWQKIIKRGWVEFTGGYNRTWRKQLGIDFYFGSQWWCLNKETVKWMNNYLIENPGFYDFYKSSSTPDESFFHTLVMLSPYADGATDNLLYQHFQKGANSPDVLTVDDLQKARESKYLIMRKVDINIDAFFIN